MPEDDKQKKELVASLNEDRILIKKNVVLSSIIIYSK